MSPPLRIDQHATVILNQKTLVLVCGALVSGALMWADLRYTLKDHQRAIDALVVGQSLAAEAQKEAASEYMADHEVILHMADQLKWAVKDQASHEHNPDKDMPRN